MPGGAHGRPGVVTNASTRDERLLQFERQLTGDPDGGCGCAVYWTRSITAALCTAAIAMKPFTATIVNTAPRRWSRFHMRSAWTIDSTVRPALNPTRAAGLLIPFSKGFTSVPPCLSTVNVA